VFLWIGIVVTFFRCNIQYNVTLRFLDDEMTQEQLGVQVGVTRQTIAVLEAGEYSSTL